MNRAVSRLRAEKEVTNGIVKLAHKRRMEYSVFRWIGGAINGAKCENLGDQMQLGIRELVRAGYKFQGIATDENGNYEKVTQCCHGNETVLAEIIGGHGGFDKLGRAKEAIEFSKNIPALDFIWLSEAISKEYPT